MFVVVVVAVVVVVVLVVVFCFCFFWGGVGLFVVVVFWGVGLFVVVVFWGVGLFVVVVCGRVAWFPINNLFLFVNFFFRKLWHKIIRKHFLTCIPSDIDCYKLNVTPRPIIVAL